MTGVCESVLNLDIAQRIRLLFALFGIDPVMTRTSDDIQYPDDATTTRARKVADQKARLACIQSVPNAFLISIHQNYYPSGGPFGAQVLYAPNDESREFALFLQDQLVSNLNPENYRSASQIAGDIYLMNHVDCPAVLIECGFLSNASEAALLQTEAYLSLIHISISDLFLMASTTPAKAIQIDHLTGSIVPGKYADLVVLDADLNLEMTFFHGEII